MIKFIVKPLILKADIFLLRIYYGWQFKSEIRILRLHYGPETESAILKAMDYGFTAYGYFLKIVVKLNRYKILIITR